MARDILPHDATDLGPNQLAAIAALVGGSSVTDAAARAGVDRTTLHRWLSGDALFVATLNRSKHEALGAVRGELRALAREAVATLRGLLSTPSQAVRLRA